jgi:hypothetical protein
MKIENQGVKGRHFNCESQDLAFQTLASLLRTTSSNLLFPKNLGLCILQMQIGKWEILFGGLQ